MAYVPDDCVFRTVKNSMQGDCKFNNAKVTGKVAAVFSYCVDYCSTDFGSQLLEFFLRKLFYVVRRMDF